MLFWYRHVFPETENLNSARIDLCLGFNVSQSLRILNQVTVEAECKPNIESIEDLEALEKIDADLSNLETLDPYFGE